MNNGAVTRTDKEYLKAGSRCRLSARGLKSMPRQTQHVCTVVGVGKTGNQLRVKFDGSKTTQTLHRSYLEEIVQHGQKPEK
jgi:hypothetical protein